MNGPADRRTVSGILPASSTGRALGFDPKGSGFDSRAGIHFSERTEMVEINTDPDVPKTMPETLAVVADVAGRMSLGLLCYIRTGDIDCLRNAANSLMRIRAMETKNVLGDMISCAMREEHPLTAEERRKLYFQLVHEATANEETPA